MFPEGFIERIKGQKTIDHESLLKALQEPSPVSIRVNPSKWGGSPANAEGVPWCTNGYYLTSRPSFTLDPLFHSGCYYPQEASGMFIEQAVMQTTGGSEKIHVLDLCGAPGGKSTHLSELIGRDGLLVANDAIRARAAILAETITKWGSGNTLVTQNDPAVFGKLQGYFDIILIDAPCSGEGMFRNKIAVNEWSVENTAHCAVRQKRILMDVWPALKENGILIYSTCTFNPCENEENIRWLTANHEAESVQLDIAQFKGIKEIDFQGIFGYGFYPGEVRGEGFFISVVRKTTRQPGTRIRNQRKAELRPGKSDLALAGRWTDFSPERILKWGDELIAAPCLMDDYVYLFQNLKVVKAGTKLFVTKKDDSLPTHELALSQLLNKDAFPVKELDLSSALAYLRRDNIFLPDSPVGWNILTYKGVSLGFANNIGNRVNNYFPVEWRIRMSMPSTGDENLIRWTRG